MQKNSKLSMFLHLHGRCRFAREVSESGAALEALGIKGWEALAAFAKSAVRMQEGSR